MFGVCVGGIYFYVLFYSFVKPIKKQPPHGKSNAK